ncbi:MAG: hypothetical protein KF752_19570 [Pirellulaceae bacterium]|nr:hypothetical protein [Pirellulaceae bacterium]
MLEPEDTDARTRQQSMIANDQRLRHGAIERHYVFRWLQSNLRLKQFSQSQSVHRLPEQYVPAAEQWIV